MTIAAIIITKDEELNVADCLESVKWKVRRQHLEDHNQESLSDFD